MSDWKEGFHTALREAIKDRGSVVTLGDSFYGWMDYEADDHLRNYRNARNQAKTCEVINMRDLSEDAWDSFDGTFNDSKTAYGVSMTFDCACGQLKGRRIRWETSFGDALRTITGMENI